MKKSNLLFWIIALLLFGTNAVNAQIYLPVLTWHGSTLAAVQPKPDYLEEVSDPIYSTHFKRMVQGFDRTYYSLRPVFNYNSSKYLLNSGNIFNTEDATLFGNLKALAGNKSFNNPIWSKADPNVIYGTMGLKFVSLNVVTATVITIRDMEAEDGFTSNNSKIYMDNKQSISGEDQYVVLSDVTRGGTKIVVVDIQTGGRHAIIEDAYAHTDLFTVRQDEGDPNARMNVGISPYGNYITLVGEYHEHLFDDQFNYIRHLSPHGHADFGIDTEGNEVYVSVGPAEYEVLSTGEVFDLLGPDSYVGGHINASANYKQPGWAYISTIDDNNDIGENGNPQGFEIIAVRLDPVGTQVRKVIHTHSTGYNNDLNIYGVPNPEGSLLMFNSAWDDFSATKSQAYMAELSTADSSKLSLEVIGKGVLEGQDGNYYFGYNVNLLAIDTALGYSFSNWSGDVNSTDNPFIVKMDANKHIVANFVEVPIYNLSTAIKGQGRVSSKANGEYNEGVDVKISAYPTWGYEFLNWEGDLSGNENPVIVKMDSSINLIAVFSGPDGIFENTVESNKYDLKCFPNPMTDLVNISYKLIERSEIRLLLINTNGQHIDILFSGMQDQGEQNFIWHGMDNSGNSLPNGMYIVKLIVDNNIVEMKKLIIK